jgi:hypothetical protein
MVLTIATLKTAAHSFTVWAIHDKNNTATAVVSHKDDSISSKPFAVIIDDDYAGLMYDNIGGSAQLANRG